MREHSMLHKFKTLLKALWWIFNIPLLCLTVIIVIWAPMIFFGEKGYLIELLVCAVIALLLLIRLVYLTYKDLL